MQLATIDNKARKSTYFGKKSIFWEMFSLWFWKHNWYLQKKRDKLVWNFCCKNLFVMSNGSHFKAKRKCFPPRTSLMSKHKFCLTIFSALKRQLCWQKGGFPNLRCETKMAPISLHCALPISGSGYISCEGGKVIILSCKTLMPNFGMIQSRSFSTKIYFQSDFRRKVFNQTGGVWKGTLLWQRGKIEFLWQSSRGN